MKIFLYVLIMFLLVTSVCSAGKKGSKKQSILASKLRILKKPIPVTPVPSQKSITRSTLVSQTDPTAKPSTPPKRILRTRNFSHVQRRCCKLGFRAGIKGFNCDWDRYTTFRYLNMEHRMKMKFFGRKPSKRTQRFVKHVERFCVKTHFKRLFNKCCLSAII